MKSNLVVLVLFGLLTTTLSAECHSHPGPVHENTSPIIDGRPRLLRTTANGKLFIVGDQQLDAVVHLLHVYGNMYQMGYAQGELLKDQLKEFMGTLWSYIELEF